MTDSNMSYNNTRSLIVPPGARVPRRDVLKLGALGLGGLAVGGTLLGACGDDDDEATSEAKERIKAHWVYIGPPDDNGWTQEHDRGRKAAQAALGERLESAFTPNVGFDASTSQLFQQLADDGNDIVFINTEYAGLLTDVAAANPDTKWVETNGHVFTDNHFAFYLAHEIPAYLLGIAAGMMAPNGRIGYIGAFPTATTYNDVNGLLLGARTVNPEATVSNILVNTFFDPQLAAQATDALVNAGVEFLFGVMDEPTFLQLSEEAGVWTGYWHLDSRVAAPTKYVNNFDLSEFGPFYTDQCRQVLGGTWSAPSEIFLLDTPLGAWGPEVPQDVQDTVAAAADQIASGDLHVYEGPLVDNTGAERLAAGEVIDSLGAYSLDFAVEGVSGI